MKRRNLSEYAENTTKKYLHFEKMSVIVIKYLIDQYLLNKSNSLPAGKPLTKLL